MRHLALVALTLWGAPSLAADPPVAAGMHERFALATQARDAVIAANLDDAKQAGADLVALEPVAGLPEPWRPWVADLKKRAGVLAQAEDIDAAASALAQVTLACASCHAEMGGGPSIHGADVPPQKFSPSDNMPAHLWSANWMWLGLISGDTSAWARGAGELSRAPLAPKFEEERPEIKALEQRVIQLADRAVEEMDDLQRAAVYGEFIGTCAACHGQLRPPDATPAPTPAAETP